jgi:ppGpp synthetase/RelA/SpoT-type nucleotidyltranferase
MNSNSTPIFSKNKYNLAAKELKNNKKDKEKENLKIVNKWRVSHNYPLQIFLNRLKRVSKKDKLNVLVSGRLKRTSTILEKLNRNGIKSTMNLTQMQDIAGCRIVLKDLKKLSLFYEKNYKNSDLKHKKKKTYNYINEPKKSGYSGIHIIYKYKSSQKNKNIYDGLLIEIQLRTELQHLWATSVEIVDFFTEQNLKINKSQDESWKLFFLNLSYAFISLEHKEEIEKKVKKIIYESVVKLNIIKNLETWTKSFKILDETLKKLNNKKVEFFLLELDLSKKELQIKTYTKRNEKKAFEEYLQLESKIYKNPKYDVLLANVDNIKKLKKAYPNYFLDSHNFLEKLKFILKDFTYEGNLLNFQKKKNENKLRKEF